VTAATMKVLKGITDCLACHKLPALKCSLVLILFHILQCIRTAIQGCCAPVRHMDLYVCAATVGQQPLSIKRFASHCRSLHVAIQLHLVAAAVAQQRTGGLCCGSNAQHRRVNTSPKAQQRNVAFLRAV
jgi:hypothetical protein